MKLDLRPRCCVCGKRWLLPESVDAQVIPCPTCREGVDAGAHANGMAANGPPKKAYAEVGFTAEQLALEFDMTVAQAHAFLDRYERWIGTEMVHAGHELVCAFASAEGIARYRDFEEFED